MWFVPNCSSMFSSVNRCSWTTTPALLMRTSIVSSWAAMLDAALSTDFCEARSSSTNSAETLGKDPLILVMTCSTFSLVREARISLDWFWEAMGEGDRFAQAVWCDAGDDHCSKT